jgi:Tfp pilus assembly major pilin PilA
MCLNLEKGTYRVKNSLTAVLTDSTSGYVSAAYVKLSLSGNATYTNNYSNAAGTVTITEITTSYLKGNYDMTLVNSENTTANVKGEFYSALIGE